MFFIIKKIEFFSLFIENFSNSITKDLQLNLSGNIKA